MEEDFIVLTGYNSGKKIYIKYNDIKAIKQGDDTSINYIYMRGTEDLFKVRETQREIFEKIENLKKIRKQNKKKLF